MPRFAANLSMLFTELPFLDRFEAAASAGFQAVEFLFPYAYPAQEIKARLQAHGLELVLHNFPAGDWDAGERGLACLPNRVQDFRASVSLAVQYATALGATQLNCLTGKTPVGVAASLVHDTWMANLRYAASCLQADGLKLLLEPINTFDIPGFHLSRTQQAIDVLDQLGAANAFLQYDIYHAQRMEGELAATMARHLHRIAHIQVADNPGRHEPGTGEIHCAWLFKHLDQLGYSGWIGCEYKPATTTPAGLNWRAQLTA